MRSFGDAMRGAAVGEAIATAEGRWWSHETRHHAVYAAAHAAAIVCALIVLFTAPPAFGWHGRRLVLLLDWWAR